jgi:molecular chaperone DnaK
MSTELLVGIDLGTTFSCIANVDAGKPVVISPGDGDIEVPSVIWFDGHEAYVGKKANERKTTAPYNIFEFVKRDIGKPVTSRHNLHPQEAAGTLTAPYEVGGEQYGAAGMSAIILRYLKKHAVRHFRKAGRISETDDLKVPMKAVITVPAYFGEKERNETRVAGYAAGFEVAGVINEPTAAALAYGLMQGANERILVFDLGGGTFDVTLLQMDSGEAHVIASRGDNSLGGRDFDEIIQQYLNDVAYKRTGEEVPAEKTYELQKLAIQAKHDLSERLQTEVAFTHAGQDIDVALYRRAPSRTEDQLYAMDAVSGDVFYFEERCTALLYRSRAQCEALFENLSTDAPSGMRALSWNDVDQVVLAGGSCRMPMIANMLEQHIGRKIRRRIEGFDYETAIAVGAALYGVHRDRVQDVLSHGFGVKLIRDGRAVVDYIAVKDSPLPICVNHTYRAERAAILEVYEGESQLPDECSLRGRLELDNPEGEVKVILEINRDGFLRVIADYPPHGRKDVEIRNEVFDFEGRAERLRKLVSSITIHL